MALCFFSFVTIQTGITVNRMAKIEFDGNGKQIYVLLYYYFFLISYFNAFQLNNLSFLHQTNRLNVFLSLGHRKFSV